MAAAAMESSSAAASAPAPAAPAPAITDYRRFLRAFCQARGAVPIFFISLLYSFGAGCVIGVTPATLADRFARLHYGFDGDGSCSDYNGDDASDDAKNNADACTAGSQEAQRAAAWGNAGLSLCLLLLNPVLGSLSDTRGRRPVLLTALVLQCLPAAVFWLLQRRPHMHPAWYYAANAATGSVSYLSVVFAALSDVLVLEEHRAPAYGLLLSGFFGGFAFAPTIPWVLHDDLWVGTISLTLIAAALVLAIVWLPEALPASAVVVLPEEDLRQQEETTTNHQSTTMTETSTAEIPSTLITNDTEVDETINTTINAVSDRAPQPQHHTHTAVFHWLCHAITRPFRKVSILNRDWALRLLTVASFFSAMVFASDTTLVIYYVEETLDIRESDIAAMCLFLGVAGIIIQGGLLQPLIAWLGERRLLVVSYCSGAVHNYLYGAARSKSTIYVALVLSQLTKTNYPLLSSLASQDAPAHEQGRVQSALFATNAVANAVGPLSMECVQRLTQADWGKGFMFTYAALLYVIGAVIVSFLPVKCNDQEDYNNGGGDSHADSGEAEEQDAGGAAAALIGPAAQGVDVDDQTFLHPNKTAGGDLEEPLLRRPGTVVENP